MTWAFLFIFITVIVIMSLNTTGPVPWLSKMRRVRAGAARKAEWMAPEDVVQEVREHYLEAIHWLHDSATSTWGQQWSSAAYYLSGASLRRHQQILMYYRNHGVPNCYGVLRADHLVQVRQFSEDGEHCLVIDQQSQRRMATYNTRTRSRIVTQDLGSGAVVYSMIYAAKERRWKIEALIQELPLGWGTHRTQPRIQEHTTLPDAIGRDS
jgi:hypothetical protein